MNTSVVERSKVKERVKGITGECISTLNKQLKEAEESWQNKQKQQAIEDKKAEHENDGKTCLDWDITIPEEIRDKVEQAIYKDVDVFSYAGKLVYIALQQPASVHEMLKKDQSVRDNYHEILMPTEYKKHGLSERLTRSATIFNEKGIPISPPDILVNSMLELSPQTAPSFVGLVDNPAIEPDGTLVCDHGYNPRTGLFMNIPNKLVPDVPDNVDRVQASFSYQWIANNAFAEFPFVDVRHDNASNIMLSQLPTDEWYQSIGDNTLADAILDRLMHNAHRIKLKGESMRKLNSLLTDGEHLG